MPIRLVRDRMIKAALWLSCRVAMVLACGTAWADVNGGIAAYQRGDYATAVAEFRLAAKRDDPVAQNMLGIMYAEGQGVERNDKTAADLFSKAQVLGSAEATANLGRMYAEGRGVSLDQKIALQLFHDSARAGYQPAMLRLAEIYQNGLMGVASSAVQAEEWRTRARSAAAGGPALRTGPLAARGGAAAVSKPVAPIPSQPARQAAPAKASVDKTRQFEKQLLERLEQYRQQERRLLVASTDDTPALAAYLQELRRRIAAHLEKNLPAAKRPLTVTLLILRDGSLKGIEVDRGSGDPALDQRVVASLKSLGRLAALPAAISETVDVLGVTVRLPINLGAPR